MLPLTSRQAAPDRALRHPASGPISCGGALASRKLNSSSRLSQPWHTRPYVSTHLRSTLRRTTPAERLGACRPLCRPPIASPAFARLVRDPTSTRRHHEQIIVGTAGHIDLWARRALVKARHRHRRRPPGRREARAITIDTRLSRDLASDARALRLMATSDVPGHRALRQGTCWPAWAASTLVLFVVGAGRNPTVTTGKRESISKFSRCSASARHRGATLQSRLGGKGYFSGLVRWRWEEFVAGSISRSSAPSRSGVSSTLAPDNRLNLRAS
jgi:hypothetical protein